MNRREFIKAATLFVLATKYFSSEAIGLPAPTIAVASGMDYEAITRNVIAAMGGMKKFVKSGDTVVIKPNIGWDRKPEYGANTHPLVVKAIAEECLKAGAKKVKIFDHTCNDPRRSYQNSGIEPTLKGIKNVEVKHVEDDRFRTVKINGVFLKEWELYDEALTANVLINVPVAKHHGLTGLTLGLKNMMGVMGGNRGYIHRRIDEALADLNGYVKSHLVIIDATRILTNHGPQGGNIRDVKILNTVIASRDIVAADAYATTLFGLKPEEVSTTVTAYKRGLGEMNLNKIKVIKASL